MRKAAFLAGAVMLCACSLDRVALRSTTDLLVAGRSATLEEPDWTLAREAVASQLKLVETLLVSDPKNRDLRRLAAEGFGGAAFLFLEDMDPARAKSFYLRGRDHALMGLNLKPTLRGLKDLPGDSVESTLAAASRDDVPDLFWAGFCWAGAINLAKDDPEAIADLPKVVALMRRVSQLDPKFQFGGADIFFGVYYASRPRILGGDPEKSKAAFERARQASGGLYLMTDVLEARGYAVAAQDRALFQRLLKGVKTAPAGRLPEARLADEIAKRKAAALLEKVDEYF